MRKLMVLIASSVTILATSFGSGLAAYAEATPPVPSIVGSGNVGSVLTASAGDGWDNSEELNFTWLEGTSIDTSIQISKGTEYKLTVQDLGQNIWLEVFGEVSAQVATVVSDSVTVLPGSQALKPAASISGQAKVGTSLSASPGSLDAGAEVTYQWLRDGVAISGATSSTYMLTVADYAKSITVKVTSNVAGYVTEESTSTAIVVAAGSQVLKPVPAVSGDGKVATLLTAAAGSWDAGSVLTYQWLRDGVAISGATSSTYMLTVADYAKSITVKVTGTSTGYTTETKESAPIVVAAGTISIAPVPTISGTTKVDSVLTLIPGSWDSGINFSFQWYRNGSAIEAATNLQYTLVPADSGTTVTARVTGSSAGYTSQVKESAPVTVLPGEFTLKPVPAVSGDGKVATLLTAAAGSWDAGSVLTYQWLRDGVAISGATSSTYMLTVADYAKSITVKVTGTRPGYESAKTSTAIVVAAGSQVLKPVPAVSGDGKVATLLTAAAGSWDAGSVLTYQWLRDGVAISGATSSTYMLTVADYAKSITVKVTGTSTGYTTETKESAPIVVAAGSQVLKPVPAVSGDGKVATLLTAAAGSWDAGSVLTYQWLRDGVAISGATSSTYMLTVADYAKSITVKVTGTSTGYTTETKESAPIVVAAGTLASVTPQLTGNSSVGSVLTVVTGNWTAGTSFTYQWFRDGSAIANATNATYTFSNADSAHELFVAVTGNLVGYSASTKSSLAIRPITVPNTVCNAAVETSEWLTTAGSQPSIAGVAHSGSTLVGTAGNWSIGTKTCTYWYENGQAIPGAFSSSYKLVPSDIGQNVEFIVVGTDKTGKSSLRYSKFVSVTKSDFGTVPPPTLSGVAQVGYKLAVSATKTWAIGVQYSTQWMRDGNAINGATGNTYAITPQDMGARISVKVCGAKATYNDLCVTSDRTDVVIAGWITSKPTVKLSTATKGSLTADVSNPTGQLSFQWLLDGVAVAGETGLAYVIRPADRMHSVSVRVTEVKYGYVPVVVTSMSKDIK